jgi:hypothetical protein
MTNQMIGIHDICVELERVGSSELFPQRTADSCKEAASLLRQLREVIITYPEEPVSADEKVEKLRQILALYGD